MTRWSRLLTAADYVAGLTAITSRVTVVQRRLLTEQYYAPGRQVTVPQLARLAKVEGGYSVVNAHYGRLGRLFCDQTGERPDVRQSGPNRGKERLWATWSVGWSGPDGFVWQMLPQVAEALEQLGWVQPTGFASPDEVPVAGSLVEGAICRITVNAYERNLEARRRCLAVYGTDCSICGFSFGTVYGPEAKGYVHVHHIRPLSEVGGAYVVDPVEDLRPVCPNCHAVLHMGGRCRSIDEVRHLLVQQRRAEPGVAADPAS
ncbi:MAG: HNH endonuclease [Bacteroidales bacterium]|nr:HNH endonuclease [Bacteroidales bacterium]